MNGEIIYFDKERGIGFATGADGNRYVFDRDDLGGQPASKGSKVEFRADGDRAREIAVRAMATGRPAAVAPAGATLAHGPASGVALAPATGLFGHFRRAVTADYANFRSRARRKEYWGFALFSALCIAIAGIAGFGVGTAMGLNEADEPAATVIAMSLAVVVLFIPALAVTVRRQHDIGLAGWFVLLGFIPTVGWVIILVFTLIPSQRHGNRWGPVPDGIAPD